MGTYLARLSEEISMNTVGFDTDLYIDKQIKQIAERLTEPCDRFYMEIGGKLIQDRHTARVLPGYRENARFEVVKELGLMGEILIAVSSKDVLRGRIRGDFRITYDTETLRTIKELRSQGLKIDHVVITMFETSMSDEPLIIAFEKELKNNNISVFHFFASDNHRSGIFSSEDLNRNPYIEFSSRMVSVIAPGGGSGKFGVCISQLYHEMKRGLKPSYFSLGAFPIYELPSDNLLNLAYLAATADLKDSLSKDPHMAGSLLTDREIQNFKILRDLASHFKKEGVYLRKIKSATDMCVSTLISGIINREIVQIEAAAEIARRYERYKFEYERGQETKETVDRVKQILSMI